MEQKYTDNNLEGYLLWLICGALSKEIIKALVLLPPNKFNNPTISWWAVFIDPHAQLYVSLHTKASLDSLHCLKQKIKNHNNVISSTLKVTIFSRAFSLVNFLCEWIFGIVIGKIK